MVLPYLRVSSNFMLPMSKLRTCLTWQSQHCQFSIFFTTFSYRNPKIQPNFTTPFLEPVLFLFPLSAHLLIPVLKSFICLHLWKCCPGSKIYFSCHFLEGNLSLLSHVAFPPCKCLYAFSILMALFLCCKFFEIIDQLSHIFL